MSLRLKTLLLALFCLRPLNLAATAYYISPSGNDADPGTLAQPWQSVAAFNAKTFVAGDQVYFEGGQSFPGGLTLTAADSGASGNPVIIGSYGTGRATLVPPANVSGVNIRNTQWLELQDLVIQGTGKYVANAHGVLLRDSGASSCSHFWMRNCDIGGFSGSGLFVLASSTGGYRDVSITGSVMHDNLNSGINCDGDWTQVAKPHGNFYIGGCEFYNNGDLASDSQTGGVILSEIDGALIEHCLAHDNGPASGCIGFWCWSADHIVMQYNESHHNHRPSGWGSDGGGFDLDGATTNSILQYNYSHNNDGAGYLLAQFEWANWAGELKDNIIRYNISENDARSGGYGGITVWGGGQAPYNTVGPDFVDHTEIYNNVIYMTNPTTGSSACVMFFSGDYNNLSYAKNLHFDNNIFYLGSNQRFVSTTNITNMQPTITFNGNNYWRPGGIFRLIWQNVSYTSLAAWRALGNNYEMESGNPTGSHQDPLLTGPFPAGTVGDPLLLAGLTNYQLQPLSPLRDVGLDLSTRFILTPLPGSQDFYGNTIPQGAALEVGAHELVPFTPTATPTITETFTISPTFTESPTFTSTSTITETFTVSPTSSETPTDSPSPTATPSATGTPTATPSPTSTDSPTSTSTDSPSPSATPTETPTVTATDTPTETPTASPTDTPTQTLTASPSVTPTVSQTFTQSPTFTVTPLPTEEVIFRLDGQSAVPNPQTSDLGVYYLKLSHPASRVSIKLYTAAFILARQSEGSLGSWYGWQRATFDMSGIANGVYFYKLSVEDSLGNRVEGKAGRVYIAK